MNIDKMNIHDEIVLEEVMYKTKKHFNKLIQHIELEQTQDRKEE